MPWWRLALTVGLLLGAACGGDDDGTASSSSSTGSGAAGGGGMGTGGGLTGGAGGIGGSGAAGGMGGAGGTGGEGGMALFGTISGECGVIEPADLVTGAPPFEIDNSIDFRMFMFDPTLLSPGGQTIFNDPNAGGSSKESEVFAFEVLHRCEMATLLKTETEIVYDTMGTITDILVEIDGAKVGVSVVRAFKFMGDYTVADAQMILTEKLLDVQQSTANVSAQDAWTKQILSVIAEKPENAVSVATALPMIDPATRGDTIVVVTVTNGDDAFIY